MARARLGLDLRLYGAPHAGLGRYAEELLSALVRFGDDFEIVAFARGDESTRAYLSGLGIEVIEAPYRPYSWQEQWYLPRQLQRAHLDLVHFPHFNVPLGYRGAYVVTIHDLIMHHFPWRVASQRSAAIFWAKYGIYRQAMRLVVARARAVIAVSHYTAEDLLTYCPGLDERLRIIPEPTPTFAAALFNDDKEMALAYNIRSPYILVVGSFYPHKNLHLLIRAWQRVYAAAKRQLVLVGRFDAFAERLAKEARARGLLSDAADSPVRFLGFVSDQDLIRLYQGAEFCLNPSLLEGAGLPGLEAMALGTPVLSSPLGALPETYGRSATYLPVSSSASLADALVHFLSNGAVLRRVPTAVAGITVEQVARALRQCYHEVSQRRISINKF